MMGERELMKKLQMFDFAVQEAALYLNSHPNDRNALAYYRKYEHLRKQASAEYEQCFGPLTNRTEVTNSWQYIEGPWPWESGC